MKFLAKLLCAGALLFAVAPAAKADSISGTIGFTGSGTYSSTTGNFVAGGDSFVFPSGTGSLAVFTQFNPATFYNFSTVGIPAVGSTVFSTIESGITLTFKLMGFTADGTNPAGPGFTGFGILSETGYTDTTASFTLNTNASAGTFVTFNTAVTPEPSSLLLLGTGLIGAACMLVMRRRNTSAALLG